MTVREQVIAAVVTTWNTGTPGGVPQLERTRRAAIPQSPTLMSALVYPVRNVPEEIGRPSGPIVRAQLTVAIEMRAVGTDATRPDTVVDAIYEWAVKALVPQAFGVALGGVAHDVVEGEGEYDYGKDGEYPTVLLKTEFTVSYQHLAHDPTVKT